MLEKLTEGGQDSVESRLERSKLLKKHGNEAYGSGDLDTAVQLYVRSASEMVWFEQKNDDMPLVFHRETLEALVEERGGDEDKNAKVRSRLGVWWVLSP